uniref:Uncharacterized protein n=1 Tax=Panagrolaimus superbus TaxID=310955 RepID=A0A914XSY9_9BILA
MSIENDSDYLNSNEIALIICIAIVTAALSVGAIFFIAECFVPEFLTYWQDEKKAKDMIKPQASKEMIAELTAKRDKNRSKNQKKKNLKDGNI